MPAAPLTIAVPKGRVLDEAVALFARAGFDLRPAASDSRKLIHDCGALRVLVIRSQDVPTYVEYGAADLGIAGSDVLDEDGRDLYEPLDLRIGACRMSVAEPTDRPVDERGHLHLRVGTKYPSTTRRWLQEKGLFADVIKLSGSVELGPLVGLCDRIVDLVSSGETLKQNGLREVAVIKPVTSRLVVNRASLKLRGGEVAPLVEKLRKVVPRV